MRIPPALKKHYPQIVFYTVTIYVTFVIVYNLFR